MSKTLCESEKLWQKDIDAYMKLVNRPRFVCKKCGRAANEKKLVCKAKKLDR